MFQRVVNGLVLDDVRDLPVLGHNEISRINAENQAIDSKLTDRFNFFIFEEHCVFAAVTKVYLEISIV